MPNPYVEDIDLGGTTYEIHDKGARQSIANSYETTDGASTTVDDTDYIPMSTNDGSTRKKALWSTIKGLFDGSVIKTKVAKTGSGTTVTNTIAADTSVDNAVGTLLNNDYAINEKATKGTSYPKMYFVSGLIANSSGGTTQGYGSATVILFASGLAEIHYQYVVTTAGTRSDIWKSGLNRNLLRGLNANIPVITPSQGGTLSYYDGASSFPASWSAKNSMVNGYAGVHGNTDEFWTLARNYNSTTVGSFPDVNFGINARIEGVAFGTFTPS